MGSFIKACSLYVRTEPNNSTQFLKSSFIYSQNSKLSLEEFNRPLYLLYSHESFSGDPPFRFAMQTIFSYMHTVPEEEHCAVSNVDSVYVCVGHIGQ